MLRRRPQAQEGAGVIRPTRPLNAGLAFDIYVRGIVELGEDMYHFPLALSGSEMKPEALMLVAVMRAVTDAVLHEIRHGEAPDRAAQQAYALQAEEWIGGRVRSWRTAGGLLEGFE